MALLAFPAYDFELDDFQREAIIKLERSRGVLVSAPTSSGKTVVAEYVIWKRLSGARDVAPCDRAGVARDLAGVDHAVRS